MSLAAGTRLGPYEILAPLGAGGMGEVYRARDTRLDRTVAIKVLPEHLSQKPQLRERFEREARAVSSLSHPHICPLYDIGSQDGIDFLVMEYLEGETLAKRLRHGALPLADTFRYAIEIAGALDAAHRKGVTHRDLKPGNIMLTKSGAKLLDFGLARMHARGHSSSGSTVATETEPMTAEGTIVGTLQYMAPEQLEGKDADARTDIFGFGATLYEMATRRRAFEGQSSASLIAAIMQSEPAPVAQLQPASPAGLDHIIRRCMAKDPDGRWQAASDLKLELEWIAQERPQAPLPVPVRPRRKLAETGLVAIAAVVIAGLSFWLGRGKAPEPPELSYLTYSGHDMQPAVSPDSRTIAFVSDRDGRARIWLKELAHGGEAAVTAGDDFWPRFSPDGSMLLFSRAQPPSRDVYRMALVGGEPRKLVDDADTADWSPDGRQIAFVRLMREGDHFISALLVASADGTGEREIARFQGQLFGPPRWSPDGQRIAVDLSSPLGGTAWSIFVVQPDGKNPRRIPSLPGGYYQSSFAWLDGGRDIVYCQSELSGDFPPGGRYRLIRQNLTSGAAQVILRIPQDVDSLDIMGPGRVVLSVASPRQSLRETPLTGNSRASSRWLTRGNSQDRQPVYSPDGEWVLFSSTRSGNKDLWTISTKSGVVRRITDDPALDWDPAFMPDGKQILWSSNRGGTFEIWIANADGSGARQVTRDGVDAENPSATRDGKWIVYVSSNPAKQGIWKIHPDGSEATILFSGVTLFPEVSPEGNYVAHSNAGDYRFTRIADGATVPLVLTGRRLRWMPDGRAVAFLAWDEKARANGVFVQDFVPGQDTTKTRRKLAGFDPDLDSESFGISPDGTRITVSYQDQTQSLMVVEGIPGIMPARRVK